jgi:hypothetical protein
MERVTIVLMIPLGRSVELSALTIRQHGCRASVSKSATMHFRYGQPRPPHFLRRIISAPGRWPVPGARSRRTQPPSLGQSPHQRGWRGRAFHRPSALSGTPRGRLALLLQTRRLAPFLHRRTADPPGNRSRPKGRVAACRGRTKPLRPFPRSSASAQIVHLLHTPIHVFHPVSLRSSFLTIRAFCFLVPT